MSRTGTIDEDGNFILDDDMPQKHYCPAGKCECDDFDNTDHFCNFADSLMNTLWKQCPRKNGRAEGLRVAVEAVEDIPAHAFIEKMINRDTAIAAIKAQEGK